ncbi:DNA phosphorothioation-dependent restriction protein DptH [Tissierella carlieri]|uniref:DNA phosphorothioation-dependent restriction protein DptH n=1 Tax=Tissierella carlieri TaxID=689904 RepID=UPI001C11E4A1|nr:DNA phosphorothioation-dependent restriction protein DptH [Tissierella carlieri]MBU5310513.1 DNA phosphorothioation-dependent restriction protein DptH [Tissierella carlieri]
MLDQFYSYLSKKVIEFFNSKPLTSGAKYNIQFEREEQVKALYDELKNNTLYKEYEYKDNTGEVKYKSYLLNFSGVKLIISATINDIQPDFLTRLRNLVGVEPGYEDKAILFIHNTNLDSIIGGTESFSKEGMPFHINSIKEDIKTKLLISEFTEVDKAIISLDLERKQKDLFGDNISIFEYRDLLEIINGTCIEKDQYKNFGLFYDSELKSFKGKKLKDRIENNAIYYSRVDDIHNYGNPEIQLERYFDEKGIEKLKGEGWKDVDYKDVNRSIEEKKKVKLLEYISCNQEWDREEGASKAKSRIRNIIVFNENRDDSINIEFKFDDYLKSEFLKTEGEIKVETSGKKIKATIYKSEVDVDFYKIVYKDDKNVKFEFKIVILECDKRYLDSIKTKYSIVMNKKSKYISINTDDSNIVFNQYAQNSKKYELEYNNDLIQLNEDEKLIMEISDNFDYESDSELIRFNLKANHCTIPIGIIGTSEKVTVIEGMKVWKLKRETECDFIRIGDNKLQHGTKEYFTRDEFRRNLQLEKQIIDSNQMYFIESSNGLEGINLELGPELETSYNEIIKYFVMSKKLPSLSYINNELKTLYENFIKQYIETLEEIEEGSYLVKEQKDLFKIGVIRREIEDREIILTSLHPLNIAYQLYIDELIGNESMEDDIIKKFTSTYLLPYILDDNGRLYIPMEQHHSPGWKYYVDESLPRYKSSRDFVSKLVYEKIEEFVSHFKYLFNMGNNAPIRINLINTGDSKEILQGIFKYYIKQLKLSKTGEVLPIDVFIYSNKNITNAFEEVAFNDDINNLKETYRLDLNLDNMSEEDVLNLYRSKVHFYSKKIEEGIEYSHITFLEMNNDAKVITSIMDDITSGVMLNGIISGVPSVFLGDSYRTGFGTKYANINNNLMKIAMSLNALNAAIGGEPYNRKQCKAISISNENKNRLDNIYEASHWVTFIDPKVDLNFFKNDPNAKDLLIIHYSDQYTTAGGYDAITVTRKSGPYQRVIEEFLTQNGIEDSHDYSPNIINMFNAINGDWLLRLLSSKSYFPKEKISILSAIKLALAEFKKDNIIWVPISLEEILRVSGGAGLKKSEGLFSAKNLGFQNNGATSDDILLIGVEIIGEKVAIHFYPIEVKIGENSSSYIEKGIQQVKSTKKIFNETLLPNERGVISNTQKIYHNFLMQLVITSAEKLELYDICKEEGWKHIIDSDLRRKLLNEEYEISNYMEDLIGEGAVISFKKGVKYNDIRQEDGVMIIEMSEENGINFITKSVQEIRELVSGVCTEEIDINYNNLATDKEIKKANDNDNSNIKEDIKKFELEELVDSSKTIKTIGEIKHKQQILSDLNICNKFITESSEEYEQKNMEVLFGVNERNNREVYWYPNDTNKLLHTNTGIIGTMGTGKTQFTKSMITQIHRESKYNVDGKGIGILIFDYKGDYNKSKQDFIDATNAKVFELYHLPFNPLSIAKTVNSKPMLPLHTANGLKETLAKAFGLGIKQETLLRDLIMDAYEKSGIIKNQSDTWNIPAPTLKNVYDIYVSKEDLKEDSLYAAFSNLIDFEIFEPDPFKTKSLFELIDGVTVIDLSGYDSGIQNLVVAITLDLFYTQMQAHGHSKIDGSLRQLNKFILVDEADNFLSKNFESLKKILKEGREFGVGTILSTQLLSHFSTVENDYANYILTWVIHKVDDITNKDVKYIFNTQTKQEDESLINRIKSLNKHYSMVKMGHSDRPIYMKDRAFWELVKESYI